LVGKVVLVGLAPVRISSGESLSPL